MGHGSASLHTERERDKARNIREAPNGPYHHPRGLGDMQEEGAKGGDGMIRPSGRALWDLGGHRRKQTNKRAIKIKGANSSFL